MGRMTSVTDKDNNTTRYTYNANGARSSITYPNGVVGTYTYNQVNLLEQITYSGTDSATQPRYTYTYYPDGNVASETKENGESTTYVYDDLGRLISETLWNGTSLVQRYAYTYDDFGNRTTLTATGADAYTTTYTYNLANHLTSEAKTQSGSTATTTYTYNRNGALTKKDTGTAATTINYSYNSFGELEHSSVGGVTTAYSYLPSGLRFSKTTGGVVTEHFYDGDNVVLDLQGSTVLGEYVYGVNLISKDGSGYYLHNGHGDVTYLTDDDGAITKAYEYDAFGNEENPAATDTNPFRYAGEYYDKETGTYYLRARYYDPVIGRFTQEDPHWNQSNMLYGDDPLKLNNYNYAPSLAAIIQSGNLYVYAMSNPTRYTDPSGESVIAAIIGKATIVGMLRGLTTGVLYQNSGKRFDAGFLNSFVSEFSSSFGSDIGTVLGGPTGTYIGSIIGTSLGAAFGSIAEDYVYNADKTWSDIFASAGKAAAQNLVLGLPATHLKYARELMVDDIGMATKNLVEYNETFGKAVEIFFKAFAEALSLEE